MTGITACRRSAGARPLFIIGLLGSKYGWVPPEHLRHAVLDAAELPDPGFRCP
jgi:hypothetical protein